MKLDAHARARPVASLPTNSVPDLKLLTISSHFLELDASVQSTDRILAISSHLGLHPPVHVRSRRNSLAQGLYATMHSPLDPLTSRLPLDVMTMIFCLCTPDEPKYPAGFDYWFRDVDSLAGLHHHLPPSYRPEKEERYEVPFPISLGQVCRRWRKISFMTPELWTHVPIYFDCKDIESQVLFVRKWIYRASTLPLTISGFYSWQEDTLEDNLDDIFRAAPLFDLIRELSPRWETICLVTPPRFLKAIFGRPYAPPSNFRRLVYKKDREWDDIDNLTLCELPHPVHLSFAGMGFPRVNTDFAYVKTAELSDMSEQEAFFILSKCSNLERLVVSLEVYLGEVASPYTLVHNSLRSLVHTGHPYHSFVRHFLAPSLTALEFNAHMSTTDDFIFFIRQSGCKLESLTLNGHYGFDRGGRIDFAPHELRLMGMLTGQDRLVSLKIHGSLLFNDMFIRCLTMRGYMREGILISFLPNLTSLVFDRGDCNFSWDNLPGLVIPVLETNAHIKKLTSLRIKTFRQQWPPQISQDDERACYMLNDLKKMLRGVDLSIKLVATDPDIEGKETRQAYIFTI